LAASNAKLQRAVRNPPASSVGKLWCSFNCDLPKFVAERPAFGMCHIATNIRVSRGKNTFGQRSLSNMQIARLALFEVSEIRELLEKELALS
jgi:hypothetical protein